MNKISACRKALFGYIITSERSERCYYYQSYVGRLDDIQTAFKPKIKNKKLKYIFMIIL